MEPLADCKAVNLSNSGMAALSDLATGFEVLNVPNVRNRYISGLFHLEYPLFGDPTCLKV
jgi:hypothetical protein